jgi:poly-beta-1,6 N-acetyl-D-glucosamine export porin PgaA
VAGLFALSILLIASHAAPAQPDDPSPGELGDLAAQRIRDARQADTIDRRKVLIDEALELLESAESHPAADSDVVRRSRFDRVVAFRVRESMEAAVSAFEALRAAGYEPPPYVQVAAADAYLSLREPEQAARLYEAVLASGPEGLGAQQSLFWARLEQEDFTGAFEAIDGLVDHRQVAPGSPLHRDARITAAMGRGYANELESAMRRLESILDEHPESDAARRSLATIYRWRGWSRRALALMQPLLAQQPDETRNALLHAALLRDLGRFEEAGDLLEPLRDRHPEDRHVQRDYEDWLRRERWSLSAFGEYGESDGVQQFGSRGRAWRMRLNAPWIGSYAQPYLRSEYSDATFPEGEAEYDRVGLGVDYRRGRHAVNLEFHRNRRGEDQAGATVGYDLAIDDHWSLAARYESFSTDVPLRARGQGLEGWKAEAALRWQASESLGLRLGVSRLGISDGNRRDAALLSFDHRLRVSAHHTTDGRVDLYGARASQPGGPYFNPERDASLTYQVRHDWLTWRRYENSFTQRFLAAAGGYWQDGFDAQGIGLARYEHLWQIGQDWFLHYGVGYSSRVYDGSRESRMDGQFWLRGVF